MARIAFATWRHHFHTGIQIARATDGHHHTPQSLATLPLVKLSKKVNAALPLQSSTIGSLKRLNDVSWATAGDTCTPIIHSCHD